MQLNYVHYETLTLNFNKYKIKLKATECLKTDTEVFFILISTMEKRIEIRKKSHYSQLVNSLQTFQSSTLKNQIEPQTWLN